MIIVMKIFKSNIKLIFKTQPILLPHNENTNCTIKNCCYVVALATEESWSLIFPSPSNMVSRVCFVSSTFTLVVPGMWSVLVAWSCTWTQKSVKVSQVLSRLSGE